MTALLRKIYTKEIKINFTTKKHWLVDFRHIGTSFMCPITHAISIVDSLLEGSVRVT